RAGRGRRRRRRGRQGHADARRGPGLPAPPRALRVRPPPARRAAISGHRARDRGNRSLRRERYTMRALAPLALLALLACSKTPPSPAERLQELGKSFGEAAKAYAKCGLSTSVGHFGPAGKKEYLGKLNGRVKDGTRDVELNIAFEQRGDGWACRDADSFLDV